MTSRARMRRLNLATLPGIPARLRPRIDPRELSLGIVHLGIGAFHRAHQAVYTEDAMAATGDLTWGIAGVTQRRHDVVDQLFSQDGLYSLVERGGRDRARVLAPVRQVLSAQHNAERLTGLIASPSTRMVTLTVTEKGYRHDPATKRLRVENPEIRVDADRHGTRTVLGQLARGLERRMRDDAGPITIISCDNLPGNGHLLRTLLTQFIELLPSGERDPLLDWTERLVAFPSTMVDRIVPATTQADRTEVRRLLGVDDEGVVIAERFSQWVIEDRFAADRPTWERAGATFTDDVEPYETMKLRLLNGSHSALAYLGALAGIDYVADVMRYEHMVQFVRQLMDVDVSPTLLVPDGFDLPRYKADLIDRLGDAKIRHRTTQIAMDGSHKLPQRLLATIRSALSSGYHPRHACLAVAAWMRYVTATRTEDGRVVPVDDPLAPRFEEIATSTHQPARVVEQLLQIPEVFGSDLCEHDGFGELLTEYLTSLTSFGVQDTVAALVGAATDSSPRCAIKC